MWLKVIKNDFYPLIKLTTPLFFTGLVGVFFGFFQTMFFAQLGDNGLAAGALVGWLVSVLNVIILGTLSSIRILVLHKFGANDIQGVSGVARDGLLLAVLLSIPLFLLFWNMAPIFQFFGQNQSTILLAQLYLHAAAWGLLPSFLISALVELLMGLRRVRIAMMFISLTILLVLFFSYFFIPGNYGIPLFGMSGAGWARTISYLIMLVVLVLYIYFSKDYRIYVQHIFTMNQPSFVLELFQVGLPMGLMYGFEVGFFFLLTLIMGSLGTELVAANQIVLQFIGVFKLGATSIAQAVTVQMGYFIGAKKVHLAERVNYSGLCISSIFMFVVALIYWLYPLVLISIDIDVHQRSNLQTINYAKHFFVIGAIFQLLDSVRLLLLGGLRAFKDTNFILISSLVGFWVIALPLGYLLMIELNYNALGLWLGMVIGSGASVILLWLRLQLKVKEHKVHGCLYKDLKIEEQTT